MIKYPPWGDTEAKIFMEEHKHTQRRAAINRMSRAIGHMNAVKEMLENNRDCSDILIQLSAVRAEITNVSKVILKDHLEHCLSDAIRSDDEEMMHRLMDAVDRLL